MDLLEKIAIGFAGLCVFLTLGLYLNIYSVFGLPTGVPSTNSGEFLGTAKETPAPTGSPAPGAPAAGDLAKEDQAIKDKLRQQGRPVVGRLERKRLSVPRPLFEHINNEANWSGELKKAHSQVIRTPGGNTRLRIHKIKENSLFKSFGFEENDVLELIDGEILQFDEDSLHEHFQRAKAMLERVQNGESISVTVTRNNRPVHIEFNLD